MSVTSFIATIVPYIQKEAKERGYAICSTVIAQAIIESRYGESGLAKYHNYFGLKCGSAWKGASVNMKTKEEYKVGTLTTIKDNFRAYKDMEAGVKGYYDFISTKRYANLKTAKTYKEYAQMLKADGYATSSTYIQTLCSTVEKYSLYRFDSNYAGSTVVKQPQYPTVRYGSTGEAVLTVQKFLAAKGYQVGALDSRFGSRTESCVKQFQKDNGLVVDGIVGPKTWAKIK